MRLLIIGTLNGQIGAASSIAIKRGGQVQQADDNDGALAILRSGQSADIIMADVKTDIAALIKSLETERIAIPVVACGISTDAKAAVAAIKSGAREYIPLPPDPELIGAVLTAITRENHALIHADPATSAVINMADKIAPSEASVLITGESGTGKEVFARYIHDNSKRRDNRFVAINCAAIPENLLESELFGYEKGAFTGAVARRLGKFEEANGGTLLLDEISEMDIRLQAKLLRAIQEREIDRIGGKAPVKINVRIIATSNRFLAEEVKKGTFREDLYFRLNVVNLPLPPLRKRVADIAPLADFFIEKYAELNAVPLRPLAKEALTMLQTHSWPGNVRELENTLHRAVLLASGTEIETDAIILTETADNPAAAEKAPGGGEAGSEGLVGQTVAAVERDLIIDTLKHCFGNRTHAANILGISIRTLRNKLKQYSDDGYSVPSPGSEA